MPDGGLKDGCVTGTDDDIGTFVEQHLCCGPAHSLGTTGDQEAPSVEPEIHSSIVPYRVVMPSTNPSPLTQTGAQRALPPAVRAGDRIAVIAPGSPVEPELLAAGVALLRSWNLEVEVFPHVLDAGRHPHLAGEDADRASDFFNAMTSPGLSAVVCARGGTGVGRTLELLGDAQWKAIAAATPRLLVGSSDVTGLHLALAAHSTAVSIFGPMIATDAVVGENPDSDTRDSLYNALFDVEASTDLVGTTARDGAVVRAPVIGGTLTLIESLLGTRDATPARGCIVLLEDIGEPARRIDRSLTHLRRSGWFDGVVGFILGSFIDCGHNPLDAVLERIGDYQVPVIVDVALGHGRPQRYIPLGQYVELNPTRSSISWKRRAP